MSDDAVNESRADWRGSDDKKPPIMGKQQPIRSYMEDVAKWASRKEVSDEKCGALMLTRGLSKCPRLMDLGKKLPRSKLRHSEAAADMSMKVRRFAELVRDRRKVGMPVGTYMEAFEAKLREIRKDGFVEVDEKLAGTLLIIGLELTNQELSELMTAIDAQKGYEAFCIHKVMDAARRVVFPPHGWGGGKPGPPQWVYYGADWGSQDWNWGGIGRTGRTIAAAPTEKEGIPGTTRMERTLDTPNATRVLGGGAGVTSVRSIPSRMGKEKERNAGKKEIRRKGK